MGRQVSIQLLCIRKGSRMGNLNRKRFSCMSLPVRNGTSNRTEGVLKVTSKLRVRRQRSEPEQVETREWPCQQYTGRRKERACSYTDGSLRKGSASPLGLLW